jgi:iron(III) transport system permease protein
VAAPPGMSAAATERVARPAGAPMPRGLALAGLAVGALMALPLVYLVIRAAGADQGAWDLILRGRTAWLAVRSVGLAAAVTTAAIAIGLPLAWLTTRTDLPGRRLWAVVAALPLVFPSYIGAFALIAALGPRGMLQQLLQGPLGIERLPDIGGFTGAFLALTLFTYPYVYLTTAAGIRGLDPSLEEAARTLGLDRWATFRRVTLPLLRPSVTAGALLVALYTLHDFGAVSLMRYHAFTQAIYLQYRAAFDRTPAAILSLMLAALALVVLVVEYRARGRARYYRSGAGSRRPLRPVQLGRWRWPALALCATVAVLALVLPGAVLLYWLVRGLAGTSQLSFTWAAAASSLLVAGSGAVAALVAAFPVAVLSTRHPGPLARTMERVAYAGYALPGLVVALAFVFLTAGSLPWLYQTLPLVVVAYVVLFLPQAAEPIRGALLQLNPRLEEAGRTLGVGHAGVLRRIVMPLVSRPAMAGAALVFLTAMKELPATLLLRPTGFETLSTRVWTAAAAGRFARASVPALMLVLIAALPLYLLARRVEVRETLAT